jgi:hypothetical protein
MKIIVTIAIYNRDRFQFSQNEFEFSTTEARDTAVDHYRSELFRKNIEAAGAFVKVDVYVK